MSDSRLMRQFSRELTFSGRTLADLSGDMRVDPSTLSRYRRCIQYPSIDRLEDMFAVLDLSVLALPAKEAEELILFREVERARANLGL